MACAHCNKESWQHTDQRVYPDARTRPIVTVYSFACQIEYRKKDLFVDVVNPHAVGKQRDRRKP